MAAVPGTPRSRRRAAGALSTAARAEPRHSSGPGRRAPAPAARPRAPTPPWARAMGAVDKNMRKELSLEIDGHACPDQYVNVGIGAKHGGRPTPSTRRCPRPSDSLVDCHTGLHAPRVRRNCRTCLEFDKDKSGYIDEEELCEMMRALEMDHSLAKAKEMMLEIDEDGSGELEFGEFCALLAKVKRGDVGNLHGFAKLTEDIKATPVSVLNIEV